jgi:alpha-beta hydrolase superfamily lysophospholipase
MKHDPPAPPELGTSDGLSYALFMPETEPEAGVVILHGATSAKESHFEFGRGCRDEGLAALAFDARGHGRSDGEFGPAAVDDTHAMVELLRERVPQVALRGSSMGGFTAIHAATRDPDLCAVVAICPAPEDLLLRLLDSDYVQQFRCDVEASREWLESLDLYTAVGELGPETGLLLLHAQGDEQVPYTVSEELFAAAHEPKRLLVLPGGHHRSLQNDLELQAVSRRFIRDAARSRQY